MNKKNMLLALAIAMIMGGCNKKQNTEVNNSNADTNNRVNADTNNRVDTLFVAGVLNQPAAAGNAPRKYLLCVDKNGNKYYYKKRLSDVLTIRALGRDTLVSYIERGDTIVVQNGKIVKNITMDRMIDGYVNGR